MGEVNLKLLSIELDSYTLWNWFEESMRTARRLPSIKPRGYKSNWVDIPKDWLAYGWDKAFIRLPPPSGKQLSRLNLVQDLIAYVKDEDERKMLWYRASYHGRRWNICLVSTDQRCLRSANTI